MDDTLERHLMALQFLLLGLLVITFARFVEGLSTAGFGAADVLAFLGAIVGVVGMLGAHWTAEDDAETEPADGAVQGDGGLDVDDVVEPDEPEVVASSAASRQEAPSLPDELASSRADTSPVEPATVAQSAPGIRPRRRGSGPASAEDRQTRTDLIPTTEVDPAATSQYDPVGREMLDPATRPDEDPV
ncbi:hypothetical protein [Haloarchaeobius sp. DT45]|uniref:hypothetical protein n=1 Tax=Haloarchaeobius sp. DT45 TaxID=3446116 RepID=UPI003F6D7295